MCTHIWYANVYSFTACWHFIVSHLYVSNGASRKKNKYTILWSDFVALTFHVNQWECIRIIKVAKCRALCFEMANVNNPKPLTMCNTFQVKLEHYFNVNIIFHVTWNVTTSHEFISLRRSQKSFLTDEIFVSNHLFSAVHSYISNVCEELCVSIIKNVCVAFCHADSIINNHSPLINGKYHQFMLWPLICLQKITYESCFSIWFGFSATQYSPKCSDWHGARFGSQSALSNNL